MKQRHLIIAMILYLVSYLEMEIAGFWMKSQINPLSIVSNDISGARILIGASLNQLRQSEEESKIIVFIETADHITLIFLYACVYIYKYEYIHVDRCIYVHIYYFLGNT